MYVCISLCVCIKCTHLEKKNGPDLEQPVGQWGPGHCFSITSAPLAPPSTACLPVSPVYKGFRPPGTEENKEERRK